MTSMKTQYRHIRDFEALMTPEEIRSQLPNPEETASLIDKHRDEIRDCLSGKDSRLILITGPCSIHDPQAGMEYAQKLVKLQKEVGDKFLVIMRVYFEKPRTTVGWKGLINDPELNGSENIREGLLRARKLLIEINALGIPCATEFLDPIVPQYISDLISWVAIGARTTESQTHREMASGLSMPVGFKNATDGSLDVATNAMLSSQAEHAFLGIDKDGRTSIVKTTGNPDVHIILRGGNKEPNYGQEFVEQAQKMLGENSPARAIMIDCSHGNSRKDYSKQPDVFKDVVDQVAKGGKNILGLMLESFLVDGNQKISSGNLVYGQSITDGCIDWNTTESLVREAYHKL